MCCNYIGYVWDLETDKMGVFRRNKYVYQSHVRYEIFSILHAKNSMHKFVNFDVRFLNCKRCRYKDIIVTKKKRYYCLDIYELEKR